jgi:hypothetical protein
MPDFGIFRGFNDKLFGDKLYAGQLPTQLGLIGSEDFGFTGLLDDYPNAAAAYSLRKLRSAYTGDAIRVRRASDNTEQDIGFVDNELDTSALTTFCSGTNGFVKTWYDQSGNGYDATQSTAANQPQIVSSGSVIVQGNKPSVKFDGSNDVLNLSSTLPISAGDNLSIFQIEKKTSANSIGMWLTGASVGSPYAIVHFANENLIMNTQYNATTSNIAGGPLLGNNYNLISGFAKTLAANSEQYANGSLVSFTFTGTDNRQPSFTKIGQRATNESSNTSFQEMIVYKSDQSSNRTGIETNINDFYSIF